MKQENLETFIKQEGGKLGFDFVRIMKANPLPDEKIFFKKWLRKGFAGSMEYLKKDPEKRSNPDKILPGVKSIICLGLNYYQNPDTGKIREKIRVARYALGRDYHKVLKNKLKKFIVLIQKYVEKNPGNFEKQKPSFHFSADTAPIFERSFAEKAGMGFIGKNSCLITSEFGSYVFLAQIITNLELIRDEPTKWKAGCGTCHRCIDICPTKAILPDRTIDASRCIAYLTIENRGEIPEKFREKIGTWLFGCDLCQEICPHNIRAKPTKIEDFRKIRIGTKVHNLRKILEIKNDEEFKNMFAGTAIMRAKHRGLIRNACIVAGNLKEKSLLRELKKIAKSKDKMLAEHAIWAIKKINT